jgi:hypothetical protein
MKPNWYDVLEWACAQRGGFSNSDFVDQLEILRNQGESDQDWHRRRMKYANTITQKMWKWGLLRKATLRHEREFVDQKQRLVLDGRKKKKGLKGIGGPNRRQGRLPVIWKVTDYGRKRQREPRFK